jgi:hypothetical protein
VIASALVLTLAYVTVAALLLNMSLATRYSARVKTLVIVLVSLLYFGAWHGYRGLMGWPTPDPLPESFRVLWISIDEPDKASGLPGSLDYWVRALDSAGLASGAPRAYTVPWSEAEAEAAQEALDRMDEGEVLDARRTRAPLASPDEAPVFQEEEWGNRISPGEEVRRSKFEFMAVGKPNLPAKPPSAPGG